MLVSIMLSHVFCYWDGHFAGFDLYNFVFVCPIVVSSEVEHFVMSEPPIFYLGDDGGQ